MISQNQGLKLAVVSLFGALPAILNGMIVCFLIVFIYAIIGMSLFKGQFFKCRFVWERQDSQNNQELIQQIIDKYECVNYGGSWERIQYNFDDIFSALFILFQIITTEGWLDVMFNGVDTRGKGFTQDYNNRTYLSLYFLSFIIIGKIFIMNLFVGIVIDKYNRLKEKMKGYSIMTKDQREWIESEKQMCRLNLERAKKIPE